MAPRKPKLVTVNEAKEFDFDAFIQGFKRPEFTRNLYQRADLLPRLSELDEITANMQQRLDQAEAAKGENDVRGIDDVDAAATLRTRLDALIQEFNGLYDEYEASGIAFTFRIPDQKEDRTAVHKAMKADGLDTELPKDADDEQTIALADTFAMYSMSMTCTSHPMTVEQWKALREKVGEAAFQSLAVAWVEATKAANPTPPFVKKLLTTPPGTPESSVV